MITIPLNLDPECELIGALCESDDPRELSQDMLEIHLPSGISIEAGWVPEADPDGAYELLLCCGLEVKLKMTKSSAMEAKLAIEELADSYNVRLFRDGNIEYRQFPLTNSANYQRCLVNT